MSDEEILDFFSHTSAQSCGRFRPDQLKQYTASNKSVTYSNRHWVPTTFLGLLLFLGSKPAYPQSLSQRTSTQSVQLQDIIHHAIAGGDGKIMKGTVRDEDHQPLPGVSILLRGTTVGTTTDIYGKFEFPQKLDAGDVLIFSFIGVQTQEYVVGKEEASMIEIVLNTDVMSICDIGIMGEVAIDRPYTAKATGIAKWWQKVKSVF
jgi:hypothetical protein